MKLDLNLLSELLEKLEGESEIVTCEFTTFGAGAITRKLIGRSDSYSFLIWDTPEFKSELTRLGLMVDGLIT